MGIDRVGVILLVDSLMGLQHEGSIKQYLHLTMERYSSSELWFKLTCILNYLLTYNTTILQSYIYFLKSFCLRRLVLIEEVIFDYEADGLENI